MDDDGLAWPSDKCPPNVPELIGVKVITTMDAGAGFMVSFEECNKSAAAAYIGQIKSAGWVKV